MNILEIGIGTMMPGVKSSMRHYMPESYIPGASLRAWNDYFVNSKIYGADIQPDTQFEENNIKTFLCDSTNKNSVDDIFLNSDIKFDIIIDDGYHLDSAQKSTLSNFFPYLKDGGLYIIEDIYPGSGLSMDPYSIRNIIGNYEYYFVGIKNNQCVIKKKLTTSKCNC
jgi:hypothetical protein